MQNGTPAPKRLTRLDQLESYQSFIRSPQRCVKHSTYFDVYDELFCRFRGEKITFIEVGVFDGGSLFMWRDFFGSQARIIGVELNPAAKQWEEAGFEIFIGSQSDPKFWSELFTEVGPVDILLDDGGHTYEQQIVTVECAIEHIRSGGLLVVEDVHTSYMTGFGVKHLSLVNYAVNRLHGINKRFSELSPNNSEKRIWGLRFYESFVAFEVNQDAVNTPSTSIENGGRALHARDFRHSQGILVNAIDALVKRLELEQRWQPARSLLKEIRRSLVKIDLLKRSISMRKYF